MLQPIINKLNSHNGNLNHALWLSILIITLIIQLASWQEYVRFDRELIGQGHYWLLLSSHFSHLNWVHWLFNMLGLLIVALFFSAYGNFYQWISVFLLSSIFVGLGLFWFNAEIGWYVGLSGVLHGLFVFGALGEIIRFPKSGYILMLLLISKLTWEVFFGALPGSEDMTGGKVITDAHLYGAIGGAVSGLMILFVNQWTKQIQKGKLSG